jgi:hypothetical protein
MVSKDVFLCRSEVITASRLKRFNLLFSHIDEQRKICGISPKADWNETQYLSVNPSEYFQTLRQFKEHETFSVQLCLGRLSGLGKGLSKAH